MSSQAHVENPRVSRCLTRRVGLSLFISIFILLFCVAKDAAAAATPVITSATTASGTVGKTFSYQIAATNTPTSYGAAGLPTGLTLNTATGLISGTPTASGTYPVTLSATNSSGTGNATLSLTIIPTSYLAQAAANHASATASTFSVSFPHNTVAGDVIMVGFDFVSSVSFQSIADSQGNGFTEVGSQLTSPGGGASRVYYAKNIKGGADTVTVNLSANSAYIEIYLTEYYGMNQATPIDAQAGAAGSAGAVSSGSATTTAAGDIIYGYCAADYACTVGSGFTARSTMNGNLIEDETAGNPGAYAATGSANRGWTMQMVALKPALPVITSATTASGTLASAFSYQITATGVPTTYGAAGLPAGLSLNTTTGLISGTPSAVGTYSVTLSATNSSGTGNAPLTLTVLPTSYVAQATANHASASASTFSVSFPHNTVAGDVIMVGFDFVSSVSLQSIADSQGNSFTEVGSQLTSPGGGASRVYYAKNIKGGADTVTVNLSANSAYIEVYLTEYSSMNQTSPIDAQAGAAGSAGAVSSGNATTNFVGDVIYGYCAADYACTVGSGFTARSTMNGNLIEDKTAGNPGAYAATGSANAGWTMQMVALKPALPGITGTAGAAGVSPTSLTFASRTIGTTSASQTVTVTNQLSSPLTMLTMAVAGDFAIASNTCGASLAAGATCVVGVTFSPTVVGARSGTLTIPFSASGSPLTVALTGTGNVTGLSSITVTPASPALSLGSSQQFVATGKFSSGSPQNLTASVTWSSSATSVATISNASGSQGLATSVAQGATTIAATLNSITGSTTLTIASPPLVSIAVTPASSSTPAGTTVQFTAMGTYNNGSTQNLTSTVTWSSSTAGVATIATGGLATAQAPGQATIQAQSGTVSGSTTLTVLAGFVSTGSLNTARYSHTATVLTNGMVLTAGGDDGSSLASAELYNPATGAFTATGALNTARYDHTATLLNNGLVLITGGYNGAALASAELYNPATGAFTATGALNTARYYHTATLLTNGMVLITGGYNGAALASAELYNPGTGKFTATGSLNFARYEQTATLLDNGLVLVAGGYNGAALASAELYNPATGKCAVTGGLNFVRYEHTATLLNNGLVLVAGGYDGSSLASAELYNPATGAFTVTGGLNTARYYHTATLLTNGLVLMAGGNDGSSLASAELYNPAAGAFTVTGDLNTARSEHTAALLNSGMVLVAGGINDSPLASAELFKPDTLVPANLTSIAVTPATPTVALYGGQRFTATGTFSDGSTQTLVSVTWKSSNNAVATVTDDASNLGAAYGAAQGQPR